MRSPDLKSTVVAAVIGAAALVAVFTFTQIGSKKSAALWGAVLGAGVQIAVRLFGVS